MNFNLIKSYLINEFISIFKDDTNVDSIFLVGSMCNNNYELKSTNDFDIRIISKNVNLELLNSIEVVYKNILTRNEYKNVDFQFSDDIGPAKPENKNEFNVLIHCLVFTKEDLDALPNIHKVSYSNQYEIFYGEDYLIQYKNILLNYDDVLYADEGIEYCIEMIKSKKQRYKKYVIESETPVIKCFTDIASENEYSEILTYSLKKSLDNLYCLHLQNTKCECLFNEYLTDVLAVNKSELNCVQDVYNNNCSLKYENEIIAILHKLKQYAIISKEEKQ